MELAVRTATETLLRLLGLTDFTVRVSAESDEGMTHVRVMIETAEGSVLIGRFGDTMQALQHLIKLMAAKQLGDDARFTVLLDVDSYLARRAEQAVDKARFLAARVQQTGRPEMLAPQNGFVRRQIHVMIAEEFPELTTESEGTGALKRVRIQPK